MRANYPKFGYYYNRTLDVSPWNDAVAALFRNNPTYPTGFFVDRLSDSANQSIGFTQTVSDAKVVFGTRNDEVLSMTICKVNMSYVDLNVRCGLLVKDNGRRFCAVTQGRMSKELSQITNRTLFTESVAWGGAVARIPTTFTPGHSAETSPIEMYLADPTTGLWTTSLLSRKDIGLTPIDFFSKRLGLVWNTFTRSALYPQYIIGGDYDGSIFARQPSTAVVYTEALAPRYALNIVWISLFFASIAVMLLASAATFVLSARTRAPDVLGYVSAQVRNSPYFQDPVSKEGTTLDGAEQARKWRHLKVRFADVHGDSDVGKIAFVEDGGVNLPTGTTARLKSKRLYV